MVRIFESVNGGPRVECPTWPTELAMKAQTSLCLHIDDVFAALASECTKRGIVETPDSLEMSFGDHILVDPNNLEISHITRPGAYKLRCTDNVGLYRRGSELKITVVQKDGE